MIHFKSLLVTIIIFLSVASTVIADNELSGLTDFLTYRVTTADLPFSEIEEYLRQRYGATSTSYDGGGTRFAFIIEEETHLLVGSSFLNERILDEDSGLRVSAEMSGNKHISLFTQYLNDYEFVPKLGEDSSGDGGGESYSDTIIENHQFIDHNNGYKVTESSIGYDISVLYWTAPSGSNAPKLIMIIAVKRRKTHLI